MQRRRLPLLNYLLGFSLTLLVVSTCFNVKSSSSNSPSLPARDVSSLEAARAARPHSNSVTQADPLGLFGPRRATAATSRAVLASRAAAVSSVASPFAPTITATKSHMLAPGDTQADPGDTLTYTVVITNSGSTDATGVNFSDTIDPNTTLVPGSLIASPIASDDSYHTIGNVNISVPVGLGVTANDSNPNGGGTLTVTQVNATAVPGGGSATTSTPNGSVTMGSDGSFTYTPNAAFRGPSDSFTYKLENGTGKFDTATVTIAVNGLIWFVDSAAAINGDGRLNSPFNCLVGASCFDSAAADIANDNIFVYSGSYTGGFSLLNGQKLIGQGAGDTLLNITGLPAPSGTNLLPATGGANPTISAAGIDLTLASGNTIRGVTLNGTAAAAIDLNGTGFGTVTIAETALSGTGQALNLSNGTLSGPVAATAAFTSISSTNSATTGISLTSVAGNLSSGSTSITNPTGIGISVNTSSAALNFGATTSTQSGGAGVSLTTNTGAITFGTLNISPDAGQKGLLATDNSNTITASGGTITTSGATAVEITRAGGTTPLVISLTSVSASGDANGILLNGTSGSFTVNGDGGDTSLGGNNSGGTLSGTTGADGATAGNGVYLNNAANVTLRRMHITNHSNFAVYGTNVTGFVLEYSTVDGVNGTNNATPFNEGSIAFDGLFGTSTFTSDVIKGGFQDNLRVKNSNGSANITVTGSTIRDTSTGASGNDNLNIEANTSAAITAHVTNNTFAATNGDHLQANTLNAASMTIVFTGNTLSGGGGANALGQGITISGGNVGSTEQVSFNISNNNMTGTIAGGAINVNQGAGAGTWQGAVSNNTIGNAGIANSGASQSSGIRVENHSPTGTLTANVTGNTVTQWNNGAAINFQVGDTGNVNAAINLTVTNNIINNPGPASLHGVQGNFGANATGTNAVCFDFRLNNINLGGVPPNGGADLRLRQRNGSTVRLPGYAGANTDTTAVANFEKAQNTLSDVGAEVSAAAAVPPGGGFVGGAACGSPIVPLRVHPGIETASRVQGDITAEDLDEVSAVLRAARGEGSGEATAQKLTQEGLTWIVQAALQRWREAGIPAEDMARLEAVTFELANLPDGELAIAKTSHVKLDKRAAGYGWYFDQTPHEDGEFDVPVPDRERQTTEFSAAFARMDLLTVVMRELGTVYMQGKDRVPKQLRPLMQPTLSPAVRRLPTFNTPSGSTSSTAAPGARNGIAALTAPPQPKNTASVSPMPAVFNPNTDLFDGGYGRSARRMSYTASARRVAAFEPVPFSGETVTLNIGTIPAGESVTIMFQVTINNPLPNGVCTITNTAHVTGGNFSPVDTNSDVVSIVKPLTIGACPADIVKDNDAGVCTAVVTFTPPTADGCPSPTVTCSPASGSTFQKGATTVTCTASNGSSPDATCSFTVTVRDTEAPVCNLPPNITQNNDPGQCSAVVNYTATATDNCGSATITCEPASGSIFQKGTTTVNCTASDDSPDSPDSACSFTVTVKDTEAPTCNLPANITANNTPGQCSAAVTYTATASDNCPGATIVCSPSSGSIFSVGTTTVNCTASDTSPDSPDTHCSFTVTVRDTQAPTIGACPANIGVTSSGGCQVVNYTSPTAADNCGSATVVCSPPSGFCFPAGTTTVTCTASDASPDSPDASCSFTVTVVPCAISCPSNITVGNDPNQCGALVAFAPTTTGGCGTVVCSPASGSFFPVGTTTVTCTTQVGPACSFSVTVNDTQGPTITLTTGTLELWPVNHSYNTFTMSDLVASATDNCSGNVFNNVVITSVSSDEPEEAAGGGDGNTLNDIVIAANCKSVQLRAERQGSGNGRVYTINLKVTDAFGNVSTSARTVVVPQSHGGTAILGPGPGYTVTSSCP
jgi:uncharacterized repeat protein (TIGR01451 family)